MTTYPTDADTIILARTAAGTLPGVETVIHSVKENGAVGDGVNDDTAEVAATIGDALSGGLVYFPAGTYLVSSALVPLSNQTWVGDGASSVIKLKTASNCHLISIASGVHDVIIRDLKLDGNGTNQTTFNGGEDEVNGVNIVSSSRILIDRVEVADACDTGIHIVDSANAYSTDLTVRDSYVHGSGYNCIRARFTERVTLTGNHFYDWGTVAADQAAVVTTMDGEARNWRVIGNHFQNVAGTKFAIETAGAGGVVDSAISGNVFDSNAIQGGGVSGMFFRCSLTGNVHTNGAGNHRSGYEIVGTDVVIADNVIENGSIALGAAAWQTVGHNSVRGNVISNSTDNAYAIWLGGSAGSMECVSILDNLLDIRGSTAGVNGICIGAYGDAGVVSHVLAKGNSIIGDIATCTGIRLLGAAGSTGISVRDNFVTTCAYGMLLPDNGNHDEVTITGNDLRGNTYPIWDGATGGTRRINNNILADNQAHVFSGGLEVTGDISDGTALPALLTALESMGLITDSTTA